MYQSKPTPTPTPTRTPTPTPTSIPTHLYNSVLFAMLIVNGVSGVGVIK